MTLNEIRKMEPGDLLVYTPNNTKIPIYSFNEDRSKFETFYNGRRVFRAIGQLMKVASKYEIFKNGITLKRDIMFYDPAKDEIIELNKGSIYLGEI